jgi:hypothetical protein
MGFTHGLSGGRELGQEGKSFCPNLVLLLHIQISRGFHLVKTTPRAPAGVRSQGDLFLRVTEH